LDEPCNGLDVYKREHLFHIVDSLAKEQNTTIVYVTQHIEEISDIFEHTMLLRNGYIFDKGLTEEMFTTEKLKSFLGYDLTLSYDSDHRRKIKISDSTAFQTLPKRKEL
jgi:iron complex transport system ATP-binding protein